MLSSTKLAWVFLVSYSYEDHITFVAINTHTKWRCRPIAHRANVMLVHCEFFTDVSISEEHGVELYNRQTTLWPNFLCQSRMSVSTKWHQGRANAIPIHDQRFLNIPNTFGDVFLTQPFAKFNESGYIFNDIRPIFHGVGFAKLWISIR